MEGKIDRTMTKAEEEVMILLWRLKKAYVKDILAEFPEPKPAYNTVSTIIRIMEDKGFVDHRAFGKTHEYFPLISKSAYSRFVIGSLAKDYFKGSYKELVSFMANDDQLNIKDIEEIKKEIKKKKP